MEKDKDGVGGSFKKLRGDAAEEYRSWKKNAEGVILGLPDTIKKEQYGVKL